MNLTLDEFARVTDIALRPPWQRGAACRSKGTLWWFPTTREADEAARAVCEPCPVRRSASPSLWRIVSWWGSGRGLTLRNGGG